MTIGTNSQPPLAPAYTLPEVPTAPPAPPLGDALGTNMGGIPGMPQNVEQYFGGKTLRDVAGQEAKVRQQQLGLLQQQTGLEQQIGENKQQQEQFLAQAKADIARQNRESAQRIEQSIQDTRQKFPYPEFHPTKDNVQDLATLFSLIGVIGVAMGGQGKMGATASLNAMSGMMQGWQKGRQDLWTKEKDEFDKNMARVKQVLDDAYKDADRAMKTLAYNREEAEAYANQAAAKLGGQVGKQILQKQGVEKFYNYMESLKGDLQKTETMLQQKELHAQTEAAAERRHQESMQQQRDLAQIKAQTGMGDIGSYIQRFTGSNVDKKNQGNVMVAGNAIGDAYALKQQVAEHPEWVGREGQIQRFFNTYVDSFSNNKPLPADAGADLAKDPSGQAALIFAKKYAEYLVNYERSLAGGAKGFTVQFQKRFNDLLKQDQFNPEGFSALMDEQIRTIASRAAENGANITRQNLTAMAYDMKTRAEDQDAIRGMQSLIGAQQGGGGAQNIQFQATQAFGSYEPEKYEYRINSDTGRLQRKIKGQ